jgi:hypothetical protein
MDFLLTKWAIADSTKYQKVRRIVAGKPSMSTAVGIGGNIMVGGGLTTSGTNSSVNSTSQTGRSGQLVNSRIDL